MSTQTQNNPPSDAESLSDDVDVLQEEVARIQAEQERCRLEVRKLREEENPATGVYFAQEIFTLQQDILRMDVEMKFRTNKINRLQSDF